MYPLLKNKKIGDVINGLDFDPDSEINEAFCYHVDQGHLVVVGMSLYKVVVLPEPTNLPQNPEEIYDTEIAPALLKISRRCQELGFPFVASVEWERGETGRTEFCPATNGTGSLPRPSAKQLLVHYAARCHGNVDSMLFAVMRDAEEYGHGSTCLKMLGCKNVKPEASPYAISMMVTTPKT